MDGNTVAGVKGTELINEDGSINFDVKAGTHGKPSAVFAEGAEDNYKLEIKANGYPDVEATDVAFCNAVLVTFTGSIIPASIIFTYSSL